MSGDNYDVGYGKPPKHSQFKKGKSGNPRGRPRGRKSPHEILHELLNEKVSVPHKGRRKRISVLEGIAANARRAAWEGNLKPLRDLCDLIDKLARHPTFALEDVPIKFTLSFPEEENGKQHWGSDE